MVDINIWTIVAIAFFTGLGSGIGSPIGAHIYEKFIKNKLIKTTDLTEQSKEKIKNDLLKSIEIGKNVEEKILGRKIE
jgi:ribosomal protein S13